MARSGAVGYGMQSAETNAVIAAHKAEGLDGIEAWLRRQSPDLTFKTRNTEYCPLACLLNERTGSEAGKEGGWVIEPHLPTTPTTTPPPCCSLDWWTPSRGTR